MSKFISTQATISINGTDLSDACARVELTEEANVVEVTDFGSGGYVENIAGLKSGTLNVEWHHDWATGAVSDTFRDLVGTIATAVITPNGTAVSAANPQYTVEVVVNSFNIGPGAVGDLSTFTQSLPVTGSVTYATA